MAAPVSGNEIDGFYKDVFRLVVIGGSRAGWAEKW